MGDILYILYIYVYRTFITQACMEDFTDSTLGGDYTIYYRNLNTFVAVITFSSFLVCRYFY